MGTPVAGPERKFRRTKKEEELARIDGELAKLGLPKGALPKRWPTRVKSAALHVLGLLRVEVAMLRGKARDESARALRADEREGLLRVIVEENAILRSRLASIDPRKRPHYSAEARKKILDLRAAQGWTLDYTAARFLVPVMTLTTWMRRIDEDGPNALVRAEPVNKYPQWVTQLVAAIGMVSPLFGSKRIAQIFGRLGLELSASTVRRRRKEKPVPPALAPPDSSADAKSTSEDQSPSTAKPVAIGRGVTSKREHHVWHIDMTWLSFGLGNWVPWVPHALPNVFPFGLYLGAVMDQWTRRIMGVKLFLKEPSERQIVELLKLTVAQEGAAPKHLISDQGCQFGDGYLGWCEKNGVKPRFGAVGEHRSIAVIERFWRTLKHEWWRRFPSRPWRVFDVFAELEVYLTWYHEHRPHQGLGGLTPADKKTAPPAVQRIEPRPRMSLARGDPARSAISATQLHVRVEPLRGRANLPVIALHA
jgi:putative transposase